MKKHKRNEFGLTTLMLLGAAFAIAVLVAISFILSVISSMTKNPTALIGAFSLIALILSGAISGFVTSKVNGDGGMLVAILSSVISAFTILAIGLIWKGGAIKLSVPLNLLVFIAVSVIASLLGKKQPKRKKRRYS